jgi:uncharacterized protein YbjT (DUF2867 family)
MKYVITGGAGNISKQVVLTLLKQGQDVTVIGRSANNLQELISAGAKAAIGSVTDEAFVTATFQNSDAVYKMVTPMHPETDWKGHIEQVGKIYAAAIKTTGVKYVVNLSSVGAHLADGVGPVSGLHRVENALNALTGINIKHLRPAYFYNNLLANIGMIKGMGIIGGNFSVPEGKFPIVSPADIADVATEELLKLDFAGSSIRYIVSDEVSTDRIASVLGTAIGKPDLAWVQFTDEQALGGMIQAGLPEEVAKNYAEMNHAMHTGEMAADYYRNRTGELGKIKLTDFAKTFATIYNA